MTDLLDLRGDDQAARPRRPHHRRRLIALLIVLALLVALVVGVVVAARRLVAGFSSGGGDYQGAGTGEVLVRVQTGDTATDIATTLESDGVVMSTSAFRTAASTSPRSRSVQPGYYRLKTHMSGAAAVQLLLDPASRVRSKVTVPEGLSVPAVLQKVADGTELPLKDLQAAAANPAGLGLPDYAQNRPEGFLFPATYDLEPKSSATDALRSMVTRYNTAADGLDLQARAAAIGRTPYDVLVVASLIEKETAAPGDRAKVARVIYNRLAVKQKLQLDSTVNYTRTDKKARLTNADTQVATPYNTYVIPGLPPTPIDSPGEAALEAALNPADGNWLYFVTISKDGTSLFTASPQEFNAAKLKAQKDGVY